MSVIHHDPTPNLIYATVATAPAPATSGTTMTLSSGTLPAPPFNLVVWPTEARALPSNAEFVRVTKASGGNLVEAMTRMVEGSSSRSIKVGDQVILAASAKTFGDLWAAIDFQPGITIGGAVNWEGLVEEKHGGVAMPGYTTYAKNRLQRIVAETECKMDKVFNSGSKVIPTTADLHLWEEMLAKVGVTKRAKWHNLIWHEALPTWLTSPSVAWTPTTLEEELERYIKTVIAKAVQVTPNLEAVDVLNEVVATSGEVLRTTFWTEQLGASTTIVKTNRVMQAFANAFIWANEVAPHLRLYYNEFNIERTSQSEKRKAFLKVVEVLKELGAPIHGVGLESHIKTTFYATRVELTTTIQEAQGLVEDVEVSEYDCELVESEGKGTAGRAAEAAMETVAACEATGVKNIMLWTWGDASSWLGTNTQTTGTRGGIYDVEFNAKPAASVFMAARGGSGPGRPFLTERASNTLEARSLATAIEPSPVRHCWVTLNMTFTKLEESEAEVKVGGKVIAKPKASAAAANGSTVCLPVFVPAGTPLEVIGAKGTVTITTSYQFVH